MVGALSLTSSSWMTRVPVPVAEYSSGGVTTVKSFSLSMQGYTKFQAASRPTVIICTNECSVLVVPDKGRLSVHLWLDPNETISLFHSQPACRVPNDPVPVPNQRAHVSFWFNSSQYDLISTSLPRLDHLRDFLFASSVWISSNILHNGCINSQILWLSHQLLFRVEDWRFVHIPHVHHHCGCCSR